MAYYIGLMSGTSMDGIDAVLCDISHQRISSKHCLSLPYPAELLDQLTNLCTPSTDELCRMAMVDREVAQVFAEAVNQLLAETNLKPADIVAIGSHGQTIRHQPKTETQSGYSVQIGDPHTIATLTGIDVVADFRRRDIAEGGHGAPLVPAFHHQVFSSASVSRVIVNIGGIANITYLPANCSSMVTGFDTGPGNRLLDYWCQRHTGRHFDQNGQWAASGSIIPDLLTSMLEDPYFHRKPPKSTGREYFNDSWLTQFDRLNEFPAHDVQATLLSLTAQSIADAIRNLKQVDEVYICGGGAFNLNLLKVLSLHTALDVQTTQSLGVNPQWVEGAAFAWLAWAFNHRVPGNLPAVTGARKSCVLGALYPA
ncbi:anhydro-N-acetylmuramic acid kinase [Alteromonas ponticola]|uniref:Anhydro-N-acetylmuramic acid kinase n=1 Tax=Alteromonas aquimaris TaxID=2998417 RepID=A0ABT3P434_9ALTE|nr:anhydro-N-acetylmuramic acid kinase [Alteromonas aquimaris]MCW8107501.1 anhydro-N-acetylmuramic acid kinase [Alteromonas aquimaris]